MTNKELLTDIKAILNDMRMLLINQLELTVRETKDVPFPYDPSLPQDYRKRIGLRSQEEIARLNQILELPTDMQTKFLELLNGEQDREATDKPGTGQKGGDGAGDGN